MTPAPETFAALSTVVAKWREDDRTTLREHRAQHEAGNDWALYLREPNGLLVWHAFLAFRRRGVPVHETILARLEHYARSVLAAPDNAAAVLRALELQPRGKVPAHAHLRNTQRTRLVVSQVHALVNHPSIKISQAEAFRRVASRHAGMTPDQVKAMWKRWHRKTAELERDPAKAARSVFDWGR